MPAAEVKVKVPSAVTVIVPVAVGITQEQVYPDCQQELPGYLPAE